MKWNSIHSLNFGFSSTLLNSWTNKNGLPQTKSTLETSCYLRKIIQLYVYVWWPRNCNVVEHSRDGTPRKAEIRYRNHNEKVSRVIVRAVRSLVIIHSVNDRDLMRELSEMSMHVDFCYLYKSFGRSVILIIQIVKNLLSRICYVYLFCTV